MHVFERRRLWCVLWPFVLLGLTSGALAKPKTMIYVSPGFVMARYAGDTGSEGLEVVVGAVGGELKSFWSAGVLAQLEEHADDSTRRTFGAQLAWSGLGLECAWSHRVLPDARVNGLQLAPFVSLMVLIIGGRMIINDGAPNEYGLTMAVKLPIPLNGLLR